MKRRPQRLIPALLLFGCASLVLTWLLWPPVNAPQIASAPEAESIVSTDSTRKVSLPPLYTPTHPVADRYADLEVVAEKRHTAQAPGGEVARHLRLVRDESFKHPLIRLEEDLTLTAGGWQLVRQRAMVADHVIVKPLDPIIPESVLLEQLGIPGASVRKKYPTSGVWLVAFPLAGLDTVPQALAKITPLRDLVQNVEPDYIVHSTSTKLPNDPSFNELWGMDNTSQSGGIPDADIDAPEAWALHTGSRAVVAAVIDSGMDLMHPDLFPNLWVNPGEIEGNGVDDDGNGYVDDVHGWNFVMDHNTPQDDNGHGTHCAGTLGAAGDNGVGVAGVCWQVSLMPLKFLNASGNGTLSDAIEAVAYSTQMGVTLSSNSWGGSGYSQTLLNQIIAADQAGILFIAAAGNAALNMDVTPDFPGAYNVPNLITVASTTSADGLSWFSNYGLTTTHLGAPGSEIYSTIPGGYGLNSGTSMAAPHVSGVCALLKSYKPALSHHQIRALVLSTVDPIPALQGRTITGGRLNAASALIASSDVQFSPSQAVTLRGPEGGPFTPNAQVYILSNQSDEPAQWTLSVNRPWVTLSATTGTLTPGQSTTLTATLNSSASSLFAGSQTATLSLHNPTTGRTQTRLLHVQVDLPPLYSYDLETDPGWPRTGQWAHGIPLGQGGAYYGLPDPASAASGQSVLGINLAGDYNLSSTPAHLTAGPFDLTDKKNTTLRFRRWLNTDHQPWVTASVEASADGVSWYSFWENGINPITDSAWNQIELNLSTVADGQPQVYVRWTHQVTASGAYTYSGWNLDDIEILALPIAQLRLTLPAALEEGGAPMMGKITAMPAPESELTLTLITDRPGEKLSVPSTVTLPAGENEVEFLITPLQDSLVDGTQNVTLTVSAADYPPYSAALAVHDDEQGHLTLTLPASLAEGSGTHAQAAILMLDSPAEADLQINLTSARTDKVAVPPHVLIPTGQTQAAFDLIALDDTLIEGDVLVQITASVANWPPATGSVTVLENESLALTLSLPTMRLESAGTINSEGTVSTSGTLALPLTIQLSSDTPSKLQVPPQVTLAAGQSQVSVPLHFQDNTLADGAVNVSVTATAAGFQNGSAQIIVADDETPALPNAPFPAQGQTPVPRDITLTWDYDPHSGGAPDSYEIYFTPGGGPTAFLGVVTDPAWELPPLSAETTFQWQVIAKLGGRMRQGPLWSFTSPSIGPLSQFSWEALPAASIRGNPFPARIKAMDANGYLVSSFNGQAKIEAIREEPESITGTDTYPWGLPLGTSFDDTRTQSIYTPTEAGPAGNLTALALDVVQVPPQNMRSFTIRLKHTTKQDYSSGSNTWEGSGWTTVYSSDVVLTQPGWHWFEFSAPFEYNGTANLMVDICFNNNTYTADGSTRTTILPETASNRFRTRAFQSDSQHGDPLTWSGSFPNALAWNAIPNLRLRRASTHLAVSPDLTDTFVSGTWDSTLTGVGSGMDVRLKASLPDAPEVHGLSQPIHIVAVNDFQLEPEPLLTGGYTNTVQGASLGLGYEYEFQMSTSAEFIEAKNTGFGLSPSHLYSGLLNGQLYHYRARARAAGLTGQWSSAVRSTQDATPPQITLSVPNGGITLLSDMLLSGHASDSLGEISSVMVNGQFAALSNDNQDWSRHIALLGAGLKTFEITASDSAVPPNQSTEVWSITRIASTDADLDANGVADLLDYAFHTGGTHDASALPSGSVTQHAEGTCLTLAYHRLIHNPSGLIYLIETSSDLKRWDEPVENPEILAVTPDANGVTETVVVRIRPVAGEEGRAFARVRVIIP